MIVVVDKTASTARGSSSLCTTPLSRNDAKFIIEDIGIG